MAAVGNPERGASPPPSKPNGEKAIVVERMTHEGVQEICSLYKRVWDRFPDLPTDLAKAWEPTPLEFTSWMEGVVYFTARIDGKMVGAIGCEVEDGSCRLLHLVADPDWRHKGVATALTHQAIEWARKSQCGSVWVEALARFSAAAELLKKMGFDECGVFHRHLRNEDVRLFEKLL